MTTEVLTWHDVTEQLPDDDSTVLYEAPDDDEPIWPRLACRWPVVRDRRLRDSGRRALGADATRRSDVSDMAEDFAALREHSQARKRRNLTSSTELLRKRGIAFESLNGGVHLVIRQAGRTLDFWPSTGRFRERDRSAKPGEFAVHRKSILDGRGVFDLLKVLGQ